MEHKYGDLKKIGFEDIRIPKQNNDFPEYMGLRGYPILLAKHVIHGEYILHAASDVYGIDYGEAEINEMLDELQSIDSVIDFLKNPPKPKTIRLRLSEIEQEAEAFYRSH